MLRCCTGLSTVSRRSSPMCVLTALQSQPDKVGGNRCLPVSRKPRAPLSISPRVLKTPSISPDYLVGMCTTNLLRLSRLLALMYVADANQRESHRNAVTKAATILTSTFGERSGVGAN